MKLITAAIAAFAFLLCGVPAGAGAARDAIVARSNEAIARELGEYLARSEKEEFFGVVLVMRNREVIFQGAYGFANLELGAHNKVDTRFPVWSLTKSFTATAVMRLVEQGKLSLSSRLCDFLSPCPANWHAITVRHLLSNSSGIPSHFSETAGHANPVSRHAVLELLASKPLRFAPGTYAEYGNASWFLLALIIEKVTGASYDAAMADLIFRPLGMNNTGTAHVLEVIQHRASSYLRMDGKMTNAPVVDASWTMGAASLYSTVGDLARFSRALDDPRFISASSMQAMATRGGIPIWNSERREDDPYGLGWWLPNVNSGLTHSCPKLQGSGGGQGFTSSFSKYLGCDTTIIVLENHATGPSVLSDIENIVMTGVR